MVTVGDYGGGAHPSSTTVMRGKFKEFCQILAKPRKFQRSIVGCQTWLNTEGPNERHGSKFQPKLDEIP